MQSECAPMCQWNWLENVQNVSLDWQINSLCGKSNRLELNGAYEKPSQILSVYRIFCCFKCCDFHPSIFFWSIACVNVLFIIQQSYYEINLKFSVFICLFLFCCWTNYCPMAYTLMPTKILHSTFRPPVRLLIFATKFFKKMHQRSDKRKLLGIMSWSSLIFQLD